MIITKDLQAQMTTMDMNECLSGNNNSINQKQVEIKNELKTIKLNFGIDRLLSKCNDSDREVNVKDVLHDSSHISDLSKVKSMCSDNLVFSNCVNSRLNVINQQQQPTQQALSHNGPQSPSSHNQQSANLNCDSFNFKYFHLDTSGLHRLASVPFANSYLFTHPNSILRPYPLRLGRNQATGNCFLMNVVLFQHGMKYMTACNDWVGVSWAGCPLITRDFYNFYFRNNPSFSHSHIGSNSNFIST